MHADQTIAAIATATGNAAIGIIRVSGPDVPRVVRTLAGNLPPPRHALLRTFRTQDDLIIDRGLVLYFPAPSSYTGDDMVEFHVHGGIAVMQQLLREIYRIGARPAEPGEFSKRAFLNGKIDLLQAEGIADLITAKSERALRSAQAALTGESSDLVKDLAAELINVRALFEATIDFSEEDLEAATLANLRSAVHGIHSRVTSILDHARHSAKLSCGINIVIIGEPNVGKSSLFNALTGQSRAIVNPRPGTTRDLLSVEVAFNGSLLTINDTAGIRDSDDDIEQEGITRALTALNLADVVLYLYISLDPDPSFITRCRKHAANAKLVYVRNKIDLYNLPPGCRIIDGVTEVSISAVTGTGLPLLSETMLATLDLETDPTISPSLVRERHLNALERARLALSFADVSELTKMPEITAERLLEAQFALSELTGEISNEDILGAIFSRFCIGK